MNVVSFQFVLGPNEKPLDEALNAVKAHLRDKDGRPTGLKYQVSRKHGPVWTIPNDAEGRTLADRIDFALSTLAEKIETSQGHTR